MKTITFRNIGGWLLVWACLWLFLAPAAMGESRAATPVEIVTGIAPLSFLVEKIGGERVRVATLLPPGQDPHTFEPSPGQIGRLSRAGIYFSLEMPFERMLLAKLPREGSGPRVVDVGAGITKLPMLEHHHDEHNHRDKHNHQTDSGHRHGELDPHIWLGPPQLLIMAEHILAGLIALDPDHAATYRHNHARLQGEIEAVHRGNTERLAPFAGSSFYVYHPAFGYFAAAYQLRQQAVEISGKTPTPRQLLNLVERARHDGVRVIFVQPQFDQKSAATIAGSIDGEVVPLDPLASDVLANLEKMAAIISAALAEKP
jgi:zinc transport system substrate-binding protein